MKVLAAGAHRVVSTRPILFVIRDEVHSRYFSQAAYDAAAEPKELHAVPNAGHVDLYDKADPIPFDKFEEFLTEHLAAPSNDRVQQLVGSRS